jgi:molecular chaperone GrpE
MSRRKRKNLVEAELEVEAPNAPEASEPGDSRVEAASSLEPTGGDPGVESAEDSALERLQKEASEMRDLAQRKQAEFENYRKRMERERMDLARYAGADVVKEVLPVLDNLERALRIAGGTSEQQLRDGVVLIHRQLQESLTRLGLTEVESQGKLFDPHIHEAVSQIETAEHPEGAILDVFQKGYLFKDRLLRPAMVSVARTSSSGGEDRDSEDEGETVRRSD